MNSKYLWHVLLSPQDDEPEIFTSAKEAADYLNECWDDDCTEAHIIPVINVNY